ncbi:hypothetical protein [Labrys miyagiensis]
MGKMILIHDHRAEAALPEVPCPSVRRIDAGRVAPEIYARRFAGGDALGALLFMVMNHASDISGPYPGTVIPQSFSLSGSAGRLKVSPLATRAMLNVARDWPVSDGTSFESWKRTQLQGEIIERFSTAANDALRRTAGHPEPNELVSTGGFDFVLMPGAKDGEPATILRARAQPWGNGPDVWPTPAPESPGTTTSASENVSSSGDPSIPKATPLPPAPTSDDPYDIADFRAGLAAGLTDHAALAMAKSNYRTKLGLAEGTTAQGQASDTSESSSAIETFPVPNHTAADWFDMNAYNAHRQAGLGEKEALEASKSDFRKGISESGREHPLVSRKPIADFQVPESTIDAPYDLEDYDFLTNKAKLAPQLVFEMAKELRNLQSAGLANLNRELNDGGAIMSSSNPQISKIKPPELTIVIIIETFFHGIVKW